MATPTSPWASASILWMLPVNRSTNEACAPGETIWERSENSGPECREGWAPAALLERCRSTYYPKRNVWSGSHRIVRALTETADHRPISGWVRPGDSLAGPVWGRLAEAGVRVLGVELHQSEIEVLLWHIDVTGPALAALEPLAQFLRRANRLTDLTDALGLDLDEKEWLRAVDEVVASAGFSTYTDPNTGRARHHRMMAGGFVTGNRNTVRPFVLVHAAPSSAGPPPVSALPELATWSVEARWATALASSARVDPHVWVPSTDPAEAPRTRLGTSQVAVDHTGLAIIGPCGSTDDPHRLRLMAHTRYADLVLLAMRQRDQIETHADHLSEITDHTGRTDHDLLMQRQQRLAQFRNRLWFSSVPWRRDGTELLTWLQEAWQLPALMGELESEEQNLHRLGEALAQQQRRRAADAAAAEHARAERTRRLVEIILALLTPVTVVSGVAALAADPSVALLAVCLALSTALTTASLLALRWVHRRTTRGGNAESPPDAALDVRPRTEEIP